MEFIKAYVYDTELDCQNSINSINNILGLPKNNEAITRTYCEPILNNSKYIILASEELIAILGLPIDFEYIQEVNPF